MYKIEDLNTKKVADLKEIAIELKLQKIVCFFKQII